MQQKQIIGGALALGLPLAAVWLMMQPPGGTAAVPAAPAITASAAQGKAAASATKASSATAASTAAPVAEDPLVAAPAPVPPPHAKTEKSPVAPATAAVGKEFGLFFTSNGLGEVVDCGCKQRPLGGIARRAKWLYDRVKTKRFAGWAAIETGGTLVADPGAPEPTVELQSRAEAIFKAYGPMRYAAFNVTTHELAIGRKLLDELAKKFSVRLTSANLVDKATGKHAFTEAIVHKLGGLKVGIFGLLSADAPHKKRWIADQGLELKPVVASAKTAVEKLRKEGCQLIVLAGSLTRDERDAIGEKVPGVDVLLGSLEQDLTMRPESMGRGFFADPYHKGKWIGEFIVRPGADQARWYVADMRELLERDQVSLERQIGYYTKEFREEAARKARGEAPKMDARAEKFTRERFAGVKAKLARVKLELGDEIDVPKGGSTLQLTMTPMRADNLAEDPALKKLFDAHIKIYPPPNRGH